MSVITRAPEPALRPQPELSPLPELTVDAPLPAPRRQAGTQPLGWAAILVAAVLACSPLASGYFDFSVWGPLALGALVLLLAVCLIARPQLTRPGLIAGGGLALLLALSAASMLWAQSRDSAWTAVNRLVLYAVIFAIVLVVVRDRRQARAALVILGASALVASAWLCASFLLGGGQGAFLGRRLDSPIGYINGTAGLLVMGIWPWLAWAESASRRAARAGALAAAVLIAATVVLTQSRALIPALAVSAVLVLLYAPGRGRRLLNLGLLAGAVALSLPWTLAVYSSGGAAARLLAPSHHTLRAAGAAILLSALAAGAGLVALSALGERLRLSRLRAPGRRLAPLAAVLALIAAAGGVAAAAPWISRQYHSFTSLQVNQTAPVRFTDAGGFRYDLWRVAAKEFLAHPVGGLGAGNYDTEYYRLRRNPQYVIQPHSLELQVASELGVGGIVALVLFCGGVFWAGFARRGTLGSTDRMVRVGALGMFTAWLVGTSVDWLYDIPGLAGMAMVAAALLVASAGRGSAAPAGRPRSRLPVMAAGAAVVAVLAASVGRQYVASRYAAAGTAQIAHSPRSAIGTLRTAARLDPYSVGTLYSLAAAYARLDDYSRAQTTLLLAAQREPLNYVPPALLGDLAMRRGDYRQAVADYRRATALDPRDASLRQSELNAVEALR